MDCELLVPMLAARTIRVAEIDLRHLPKYTPAWYDLACWFLGADFELLADCCDRDPDYLRRRLGLAELLG